VELGRIAAGGQVDPQYPRGVRGIRAGIMGQQTLADATGRDPNNCVLSCIVGGVPAEQFHPDDPLLESVLAAAESMFHQVSQKRATTLAAGERMGVEDAFQFLRDEVDGLG
jgi:hypothetical protein